MGKQYVKAYFEHFQKSEPEEDQDDRNALYCLCTDVMRYFVDKFPEGYEGWAKERGEEPVIRNYSKFF
ncbi:MAG: hypothetical protein Q9161_004909 [Pseudevernia consocians]